jgi:hypothetical protein
MRHTRLENKTNKVKDVIQHILRNNNHDPTILNAYRYKQPHHKEYPQQQKQVKVTFMGNEIWFVTKLLQKAGLRIAYTTRYIIKASLIDVNNKEIELR